MKTVTTYAEKKAKQFLNLLQGYTKGIRLTAVLILLLMGVNNVWGDNNVKVYCAIKASDLNCYTLKVNANIGDNGTWRQYTMEKLDETYEGRLIYQATIVEKYGGVDALQFQLYDGNTWKSQKQPYGSWTTSSTFANKLYVYDTNKWSTKTNDPSYTVYFVNKDSWTGTIKAYAWNSDCDKNKDWSGADMTSTGKTYQGKNIYSITINKRYANIIFNNGSSKTGDLTLGSTNIGKMYDGSNWVDYNVDPVVTFKANGGTGSDYTQTVNYNTSTALTANTFTRTGYTFTGWNTKTDGTGTSYTDKQKVTLKANTILYAKWTEKTYAVTISAGNGGTVSPSGSQTIGQVTKTTVTATANDNYEFANWTATGGVVVANTTSAATTITATAAGTLTANFRSTATNSLTVVAGAGIESVAGSQDPVTLGSTHTITATPKTGYTFSTWTANPAANATFASATSANTTVTVKNGSVTVTASATENMSTLTTSNKYDAGDPGYEVPAASVNSIGYETTATVTATAAGNGYTFTGWTLTNCTRTDGGADDATSITVRSNGDGKAATVVANYAEDLTTSWVLKGSFVDDFATAYKFVKKSGESTGKVAYVSLDLADSKAYQFKVVDGDTWYGNNNSNEQYWIKATTNDWVFYSDNGNCYMKSSVAGTYTFKIDFSGTNPKVSVQFPTAYKITYGVGTNKGTDKVTTTPSITSESLVLASTPITFSKGATKAGYTWKNWNSKKDGTGTVLGTDDTYVSSNRAADITVYACYDLVGYTVTLDPQEGTGGTASVSAKLNTPMPEIELPTREAYDFGGYYDAEGGQGTQYYKPDGTSAKKWDKTTDATLYAHWIPTEYNITYELNGGTNHASNPKTYNITQEITLQDPTYTGHIFKGWFDNADFTGDAVLSISAGSTGAKTFYAKWEIGTYEITLDLQQGTGGTQTISATFGSEMPAIITPTREGYLFNGYYDQTGGKGTKYYDETGKNIKNWNKGSATLYAYWVSYENCIFFKNNLKWNNVYVYTFSADVWDGSKGVQPNKNTRVEYGKMTQIGQTDVYCYILTNTTTSFSHIAFCDKDQNNYDYLYQANAAYRGDRSNQMPLFIPQTNQTPNTSNQTKYYNSGIWMKYNSTESGYLFANNIDDKWNDASLVADAAGGYHFETEVSLSGNTTYKFKIKSIKEDWFRTSTAITSTKNTDIEFKAENGGNDVQFTTTSPGTYIISIDLTDGKMMVSVEYPLQANDYRLVYVESEVLGQAPYTKFHPAQSIRGIAEGTKKDTVSFYINKDGNNPAILLQQCTNINGANITWTDVAIQHINGNDGATPTAALAPAKRAGELYIGTGSVDVTKNGVYNFTLGQTDGNATILNEETHPYTGDYYIRTNAADGGWRKYNTNPDNIMTHSQTALKHGDYDYYFCKWVLKDQSVQYVVANDYSYCVSDTLTTDSIVTNVNGILPANANVRYTWNSSTNTLSRAYLAGSGIISDRYLVLIGDANLKDTSGKNFNVSGLKDNEVAFEDMGNWLYQLDVKANPHTQVKLTADYNEKTQYFIGSADTTKQLIKGNDTTHYALRLIYDFKTNYLVSGLVGNQTITGYLKLEEVMIVRSHHDEAQTLKISDTGSVTANKAYGVMTFNKDTLNDNTKSQHERALYWVSFPFNVKLDEAFGFGNYGEHWIMEYYDGEARAKNGAWVDSDTYWKYITEPKGYTLEAGKGYVLCLDLDLLGNDSEFWDHENTEIALYFPSNGKDTIVINNAATQRETTVPTYTCTIERDDRNIHDSNWNIIGVPAYTKIAGMIGGGVISYYRYDASKNEYDPAMTSGFNFNTMHAYMVQYAGTINWTEQATSIAALAARKSPTSKDQYTLRLALQQEDAQCDHTFIRLQEDNATAEFDMNYDLCKIINSGANIYSMIGNVEVAANVLPMQETTIPLGVEVDATDTYTFAMPDGTDGITAILIDYVEGTETNLLFSDYTTTLNKGINNGRFALRVRPNHVATEVETIIDGANGQIQKYIINGALYILNNGQLYDAQGRMVQP